MQISEASLNLPFHNRIVVLASPDNEKTQKRGKWVQDAAIQDSNTDQLPPHATLCNTNYENY